MVGLIIKVDKEISFKEKYDSILIIENIRDAVIKMNNNEPDNILNIINNKEHSLPNIIFSRPYKNMIKIFGIGEKGSNAINAIFKNVLLNGYFKIKDKNYNVVGIPSFVNNNDLLPFSNGGINHYTTITPINVFNKHNHGAFKRLLYKHFPSGNFDINLKENVEDFYSEIKEFTNEQIKNSIAYICSKVLNKPMEDFEFIKNIEIEWESILLQHKKYHSEEKAMPMITGRFKSNFVLPKFVGYKIGKGFGELSLKANKY